MQEKVLSLSAGSSHLIGLEFGQENIPMFFLITHLWEVARACTMRRFCCSTCNTLCHFGDASIVMPLPLYNLLFFIFLILSSLSMEFLISGRLFILLLFGRFWSRVAWILLATFPTMTSRVRWCCWCGLFPWRTYPRVRASGNRSEKGWWRQSFLLNQLANFHFLGFVLAWTPRMSYSSILILLDNLSFFLLELCIPYLLGKWPAE